MTIDGNTWLEQALAEGRIERVDRAFARFLRTLDPAVDPRVQVAAALLSRELGEGHICMPLTVLREREPALGEPSLFLASTPLVASPDGEPSAPLVLDLVLFMDLAQRAGMRGIQEWLSFYFKGPMHAPEVYPEHDIFIQLMKLKNTLRWMRGEELITHLGLEYYD